MSIRTFILSAIVALALSVPAALAGPVNIPSDPGSGARMSDAHDRSVRSRGKAPSVVKHAKKKAIGSALCLYVPGGASLQVALSIQDACVRLGR